MRVRPMLTVLAGGVGAAKFLRGLIRSADPAALTIVVNTGDDDRFFGLDVSPDLDTVTYTLAGLAPLARGWGRDGESFTCLEALGALYDDAGWFQLGDKDLATHVYRTDRLARGATLSQVTAELGRKLGVATPVLPMTNDSVRTIVTTRTERLSFQQYLVARRARPPVRRVSYTGAQAARPAPGVLAAIRDARAVVIAPSNPFLSIGPILAVPGIRAALRARRGPVVAISPLVGGRAVSGPLARLLRRFGYPASSLGIARCYRPFLDAIVIDEADAADVPALERVGCRAILADTLLTTPARAERVATKLIDALGLRT
ncbi:MAG: 2-phospho-L-lactate transferase [Candidatus Binatia bacterium]